MTFHLILCQHKSSDWDLGTVHVISKKNKSDFLGIPKEHSFRNKNYTKLLEL